MIQFRRPSASALVAVTLLGLAGTVAVSWIARFALPLHAAPGAVMVFSSAACLCLIALAHCSEVFLAEAAHRNLQTLIGAIVSIVGVLALLEHASGAALSIDWAELHRWASPDEPSPGRMSVPSALTFVVAGAVLVLMNRATTTARGLAVQTLTALSALMGAIGIVGWLLHLDLAYENYLFGRMSLLTAIGFVLVGAALWLDWRRMDWYRARRLIADEGLRMTLNAMGLLAIMLAIALFSGFALVVHELGDRARAYLSEPLARRVEQLRSLIDARIAQAGMIATHPVTGAAVRSLNGQPTDAKAVAQLQAIADALMPSGFSAIALQNAAGRAGVEAGRFAQGKLTEVPLPSRDATLLWDDGFVLRVRLPVQSAGAAAGFVIAEQRLHQATSALEYPYDFAATGLVLVCGRREERVTCFTQHGATTGAAPPASARQPMTRAFGGQSGVMATRDEEGARYMTAYSPVGNTGLGLVAQMRTTELYAPVRQQTLLVVVLLAGLLLSGSLLLYWRIAPLARRLFLHEQRLKLALDSSRSAVWDADLESQVVYLSEQWPVLLGGDPQASSTPLRDLYQSVHPDDAPLARRKLRAALKSDDLPYEIEHRVRTRSGDWTWIHSVGKVIERDHRGRAVRMIGINTNIARRKQEQSFIERRASRDEATGLPNRSVFTDRLHMSMARSRRAPPDRSLMAILFVHVEEYRHVEDSMGSEAAKTLLKEITQRFQECIRTTDSMARIGPDEFAIVLEELGLTDQASHIADKLIGALRAKFTIRRTPLQVHVNIGISFYDGVIVVTAEELVARAQNAMFEAQTEGSNSWRAAL